MFITWTLSCTARPAYIILYMCCELDNRAILIHTHAHMHKCTHVHARTHAKRRPYNIIRGGKEKKNY